MKRRRERREEERGGERGMSYHMLDGIFLIKNTYKRISSGARRDPWRPTESLN